MRTVRVKALGSLRTTTALSRLWGKVTGGWSQVLAQFYCEFEASLIYKASSRTARTVTQRDLVLKKQKSNLRA